MNHSRIKTMYPGWVGLILLLALMGLPSLGQAQADRFFKPTEGFTRAKDLPEDFNGTVRSIQLDIKDAFEGTTVHSDAEQWMYDVGNKLHIDSKPSTIRRRLLFREGDAITKSMLLESEKTMRAEEFLADAIIQVKKWEDGTVHIIVTTYDQWTTVPGISLQRLGGEWIYWLGPVESNLLGTGQRLGFFVGHDQYRDTRWLDYNNNALFSNRLHLMAHSAWLSDGYSVLFSLSKPLQARTDNWAFAASLQSDEFSEYVYFDGNRFDDVAAPLAHDLGGIGHGLRRFKRVDTHDFDFSITRSYGYSTKFNVSPTFNRHDRYNHGDIDPLNKRLLAVAPLAASAMSPDVRSDDLIGLSFSLYQYNYKTVQNFNNLKWSETLETGWRISTKVALNQKWLGADNADWYLSHSLVYNNAFWDAVFFSSNASLRYFLSSAGKYDDGYASSAGELQWKPIPFTSSFLSANWSNYFAAEKAQQLLLGEDTGLNGYPNFYYAGQARILLEAEQRFFPSVEVGTVVPAVALFANAGNTFPDYAQFDPNKLHYGLGFGLRLGASKSTQKVVNHINFSWPVGEKNVSGLLFSVKAKKSL